MRNKETPLEKVEIRVMHSDAGVAPDERTEQLLRIFSELEVQEATMSQDQFSELLREAAVACGFADPAEACESLIGAALFQWQRRSRKRRHSNGDAGRSDPSPAAS
jgi:hypothetical protein